MNELLQKVEHQSLIKKRPFVILKLMTVKATVAVVLFSVLSSSAAFCQPPVQKKSFPIGSWIIYSTGDSVSVCFSYSIPFNDLIFVKSENDRAGFGADISFSIDAVDSATGTNYHGFRERHILAADFSETRDTKRKAGDYVLLKLPCSKFKVTAEIRDDSQHLIYSHEVVQRDFERVSKSKIVSVFFLDSLSDRRLYPATGTDVAPFPGPIEVITVAKDTGSSELTLTLTTEDGETIYGPVTLSAMKQRLEPADSNGLFALDQSPDSGYSIFIASIKIDSLEEGSYRITEELDGDTHVEQFSYVWLDKPVTLENFPLAVSLLKYIVPDSIYSEISSGNQKEVAAKFKAFWKSRDPTPETAYNELEAEFYERADYASEHFRSLDVINGAETDRGKSYILYGPPAAVKRDFRSDGTYEIWTYPLLQRAFIFKEEKLGDFVLFQTEKL